MRNLTVFFVMLYAFTGAIAQNSISDNKLSFSKQEIFNDYKIVYFVLDRSIDYNEFKVIMLDLISDNKVAEMWLDGDKSCKAEVDKDVTPEYILKYLKKYNYDYAYLVIEKNISNNANIESNKLPLHYPEKIKADGKVVDDASYQKAIEFWKKRYPKEWKEYQNQNIEK